MSELLTILNSISTYIESNYPNVAAKLPPGLSLETIQEIFENQPYQLPQEVYEFYHWCSGWDWETENWDSLFAPYYGTMTLCSPKKAIETALYFEKNGISYIGKHLIPLFGYDRIYLCIVENWQEKFPSPIIYVSELYGVELHYVSLTAMMQVTAETWNTSTAYINQEGLVECDEQKFIDIYRQHNSELPQMVLARFKQELEIAGSNSSKLYKVWNNLSDELDWLDKCFPNLSFENFRYELVEPIIKEMNKKEEYSYSHFATKILGKLKYSY
ncbi:MAG: hypothetical protein KI793_00205 [Rivularia sp. (in: Bacteria)]|nr:hypothetical protein [Rivularia sp. MS3]